MFGGNSVVVESESEFSQYSSSMDQAGTCTNDSQDSGFSATVISSPKCSLASEKTSKVDLFSPPSLPYQEDFSNGIKTQPVQGIEPCSQEVDSWHAAMQDEIQDAVLGKIEEKIKIHTQLLHSDLSYEIKTQVHNAIIESAQHTEKMMLEELKAQCHANQQSLKQGLIDQHYEPESNVAGYQLGAMPVEIQSLQNNTEAITSH